jgi:glutathione reductase (NADPH)
MAEYDVDLFIIGAGSGGVRAARIACEHGARVMIAEEYRVGGTCVIRGCVPKKLLVYASRYSDDFVDAAGYGWTVPEPTFHWSTLIANKDAEVARLERAYITTLERVGAKLVKQRAVLEDAHTVRLADGSKVSAKYILIATGGGPAMGDDIPGLEYVISSNEAFYLPELPKSILIQGGGYIALEFAGIFAGFGSKVTVVYRRENILRGFDDDVREHSRMEFEKRGIKVITGTKVAAVEASAEGFCSRLSDGTMIETDRVMFAVGRKPHVKGVGLEAAGVKLNDGGGIAVNEYSQTSVPNIYALGDVTDRVNLTPVAVRDGHYFADTVFGNNPKPVDHEDVPTAVFSTPEVGVIGMTEAQACARLPKVDIYKTTFRPMQATVAARDTRTFMKLVVDGSNDRVVGVHIVGPGAGEMIQLVGIAVKMKATKAQFDAVMAVHPTAAEELVTMRDKAATIENGPNKPEILATWSV